MKVENIKLVMTCGACPEQYEAYVNNEYVAYLRLRHGYFSVSVSPVGELIYDANPDGDGIFTDYEREKYLSEAKKAIVGYYNNP